ncbi:MAG: fluoride efflux transporter CrcB [Planctomycetota bacterium]
MTALAWVPLVFLGGGAGSVLRHATALLIDQARDTRPPSPGAFPYATLAVNVVGCIAIGIAAPLVFDRPTLRLALVTGVLGGFTTYSSFGLETTRLLSSGHFGKAAVYVLVTNTAAIGAAFAAYALASGGTPAGGDGVFEAT